MIDYAGILDKRFYSINEVIHNHQSVSVDLS